MSGKEKVAWGKGGGGNVWNGGGAWKGRGCVVKGGGNERKGSKDVSPCCRLGLSRWTSIMFIGSLLLY